MKKKRFLEQRKSKLMLKGDKSFQFLKRIIDNAYKVDLPCEYDVTATFSVSDLSLFDVGNNFLMNPFEEREGNMIQTTPKDPLHVSIESITRSRAKKVK
jgi:hypothetical protein